MTKIAATIALLCALVLFCFTTTTFATAAVKHKLTTPHDARTEPAKMPDFVDSLPTTAPREHYDLPITPPPQDLKLEQVIMFSRHGNRASDPVIQELCPNRKPLTDLYIKQQAYYGALTYNGIKALWDLGRFTNYQYVQSGFISGTYNRVSSQVRAAQSDRTLISASSWGATTFSDSYAETPFAIPVAVLSSESEEDDLLEVRKARCTERLEADLHKFDNEVAPKYFKDYQNLLETVSQEVCGIELKNVPTLTHGEFSIMQMVKDINDALTGDLLEDFPESIDPEVRQKFLQFAEDIFKLRHYGTPEMNAYLSGSAPTRMVKLMDRRVSFLTNTTVLDSAPTQHHNAMQKNNTFTYRDVVVSDAKRLPVIKPRPPRIMFAYHAHREVLYALKNLLQLDLGVERPGLPVGLLHPSTGFFFELYRDEAKFQQILDKADQDHKLPVLQPNRSNKQRYLHSLVDDAFSVRILLWVPCFPGMEVPSGLDKKTMLSFTQKDEKTGQELCLGRVRTLPQCDNLEYCPYTRFKTILAENLNAAGGDYRTHCPVNNPFAPQQQQPTTSAASFTPFSTTAKASVVDLDRYQHTVVPTTTEDVKIANDDDILEDVEVDPEDDSVDDQHIKSKRKSQKKKQQQQRKAAASRRGTTHAAGFLSAFDDDADFNTKFMDKSAWVNSLAQMPSPKPIKKE